MAYKKIIINSCEYKVIPSEPKRRTMNGGYWAIWMPFHKNSNKVGLIPEHVYMAYKVLGKFLPKGTIVHHADEDKTNNVNSNLVICQDENYHRLLHKRMRAYKACGNPNWFKCTICKQYDDPKNLYIFFTNPSTIIRHRKCYNEYMMQRYKRKKEANY